MKSREIVLRTLEFTGPERVAASFPHPYWNDFRRVHYATEGLDGTWHKAGMGRQERTDQWGNTWARVDATSKGEVARGVLQDWDSLETLRLPDLANPALYADVRQVCGDPNEDRFRIGGLPGFPFNVARKMRRLDRFLADVLLSPHRVRELLQRVEVLLGAIIGSYAQAGVDAVMFAEDWGTQRGLMVNPKTWRGMFKLGYSRLCRAAHDNGIKVIMHSCGRITEIIPDLVEVGIDALQFDQPRLHGIDELARFHGRMTFWCPVDIQTTLQTKDEASIEAEAVELTDRLGGPKGGFIAGHYGDNVSIGLDPRWQDVACHAFMRYGIYPGSA